MPKSHLSVRLIPARIVRSCQRTLVRAGIVRDLVRDLVCDHVPAAHVRGILVRANLLSCMMYCLIHTMKDWLDLKFNCGGSEGEVDSTESPSEPNRAGIDLVQLGLSDHVGVHL
jgi:hypothetical protein